VIEVTASGGDAAAVVLCWPRRLAERLSRIRVSGALFPSALLFLTVVQPQGL